MTNANHTLRFRCPRCKAILEVQQNELARYKAHLPFCSERCKLIDLGQWADESYRIPVSNQESGEPNKKQ